MKNAALTATRSVAASVSDSRRRPMRRRGAARSIPEHLPDAPDETSLVSHPDGWYWIAPDGHQQFGPFASSSLARADRDRAGEEAVSESEREAQEELGVDESACIDFASPLDSDDSGGPIIRDL